jgi:hypothetical protein
MAGTKPSGRPGGNPDLEKHQFTTDKPEACTGKLDLRVAPTDLEKLKAIDGWRDILRDKIKEIIT